MILDRPEFTPLERGVLLLVSAGYPNRFIQHELKLAPWVLNRVLASIYIKSGVHRPREPFIPTEVRERLVEWAQEYFAKEQGR
jgi:hypothetical protein